MDPNSRYYGAAANYNKPNGGFSLNKRLLFLIGGVLIGIILIVIALQLFNSLTSVASNNLQRVIAREQELLNFTTVNQKDITDDDLIKLNSELSLYLASDIATLEQQAKTKYNVSKISATITESEADTTSKSALQTASQNGRFNETYQDLLKTKINSTIELAQSLQSGTSGQINAALQQNILNLQAIALQF